MPSVFGAAVENPSCDTLAGETASEIHRPLFNVLEVRAEKRKRRVILERPETQSQPKSTASQHARSLVNMADQANESGGIPPASGHDGLGDEKVHRNVVDYARAAEEKEQSMTLLQGIKLYPKAVLFSFIISTCIVMEGYDISLINNFCMALSHV